MLDSLQSSSTVRVNAAPTGPAKTVVAQLPVTTSGDSVCVSAGATQASVKDGFYKHISNAISINEQRKPIYAKMTDGKSRAVSDLLITLERLTIPLAIYFDYRATRFNDRSIPIVGGDFVSMDSVRPPTTPPLYRGQADDATIAAVRKLLSTYKESVDKAANAGDFASAAADSYDLLKKIEGIETATKSHFCMIRHIVESSGMAALNAAGYARETNGKTVRLSRDFLKLQVSAIELAATVDHKAQAIQAMGVGILYNDLPIIPFETLWESSPLSKQTNTCEPQNQPIKP